MTKGAKEKVEKNEIIQLTAFDDGRKGQNRM